MKGDVIFFSLASLLLHQGLKHMAQVWPMRAFCAFHETFWEFSNNYHLLYLVYSLVFKSAWLVSEQVPNEHTNG